MKATIAHGWLTLHSGGYVMFTQAGRTCVVRNPKGTLGRALAFLFPRKVSERVVYPWPIGDFHNAMDEVIDLR